MERREQEDDLILETYVLKDPIKNGQETIYQLEFRQLTAGMNVKVEKIAKSGAGQMEQGVMYIHLVCKLAPPVVEKLSHRDFVEACQIVDRFLEQGLESRLGKT